MRSFSSLHLHARIVQALGIIGVVIVLVALLGYFAARSKSAPCLIAASLVLAAVLAVVIALSVILFVASDAVSEKLQAFCAEHAQTCADIMGLKYTMVRGSGGEGKGVERGGEREGRGRRWACITRGQDVFQ